MPFSPGSRKTPLGCGSLRASPLSIWWNASPGLAGWWNSTACFIAGDASSRCFRMTSSSGTDARMVSSLGTSSSATNTLISPHGMASAKGSTMSSAMITGMHPNTTASTSRGLHGAHPSGHRQKMARCMSS
ncbi:Os01g0926450 [Oryza sativa Japonica Group]|uniref:Os01g0926450 protein n=1 Tax=Oryza sativa subsp. japonica TaxID=39947 RepID=C7IX04_ORYSJ|nr:Os01g0926450 [Oryza sativa Japonica Group]|eukprot:NP_001172717.1 Os01g0926450 [Oryza sativa Japonica Group]